MKKFLKRLLIGSLCITAFLIVLGILLPIIDPEGVEKREKESQERAELRKQEAEQREKERLLAEKERQRLAELKRQGREDAKRLEAEMKARAEDNRKRSIAGQMIGNEHFKASWYLKNRLNDPKSYEHIRSTVSTDKSKTFRIVTIRYRGRNLYNALVVNTAKIKVDMYGNVLALLGNE